MDIDIKIICRVCLQSERLFHSICEEFHSFVLMDIVKQITNIQINKDDQMPQQICHDCTVKLIAANDIRRIALASDQYLRTVLEKNNEEDEVEPHEADTLIIEDQTEKDDGKTKSNKCEYHCDTCSKTFQNLLSLRRHTKYHRLDRIKCPLCPRNFSQKSNLKRHLVIHADSKNLLCDRCSGHFDTISDLYEHVKSHESALEASSDEYILSCDLCPDCRTASYVTFRNHMREKHNFLGTLRPFICRICGIRFTSKQGMFRHIDNIHENNRRNLRNRDKNFLCTTCGKSFYTNFHLQVHMRSHTGQRPFVCQHPGCLKAFSQLSGLKMHTFTHTGERPFGCKVCGKSFSQYGHVREHMMIHSNMKPHVCKVCNHSFRVKGNLTAHMMTHSGKKPHICPHCRKQFIHSSKLRLHMEKKHPS
uniref:Zinc finger protein n=1 Tax=Phlebotomus papatasi TaxID=29031 RepID=A0A1B0DFH2_PHLPP